VNLRSGKAENRLRRAVSLWVGLEEGIEREWSGNSQRWKETGRGLSVSVNSSALVG